MARRSRQRDTNVIPSDPLLPILDSPEPSLAVDPYAGLTSLLEVEDNRQFHPEQALRPALTFEGTVSHVVDAGTQKRSVSGTRSTLRFHDSASGSLAFREADRTVVCVRRQQRKEVMFAMRKAGRGGRFNRRRRRSFQSEIKC